MREDAPSDPFAPPPIPTEVYCLHCHEAYDSWRIEWRPRAGGPSPDRDGRGEGDWCCPTPGCDGLGFCFDIWPTDPEWRDENGEPVCCFDDEEDGYEAEVGGGSWSATDGDGLDEFDLADDDQDFDWVPINRPSMTPEEQEAFDRYWDAVMGEGLPPAADLRPRDRRGAGESFDEDDIPF